MQETRVRFLGREDPLEKEMATHSSILAWRMPWTEEPVQATVHGVARVGQDLATQPPPPSVVKNPPANAGDARDRGSIPGSGRSPGGGHGNPLQYSCLEDPVDGGAWQATVYRVAESDVTEHARAKGGPRATRQPQATCGLCQVADPRTR